MEAPGRPLVRTDGSGPRQAQPGMVQGALGGCIRGRRAGTGGSMESTGWRLGPGWARTGNPSPRIPPEVPVKNRTAWQSCQAVPSSDVDLEEW